MAHKIVIIASDEGLVERVRDRLAEDACLEVISPEQGALARVLGEADPAATHLVSLESPDPLTWISGLRRGNPQGRVIAAGEAIPAELALAALDAGADECLDTRGEFPPLTGALGPGDDAERSASGRLICFLSAQHGGGASTAAAHTAATLAAECGESVLLVELDFHSGALAHRLRLEPERTIAELARYWHIPEQVWRRAVCSWQGVDVLSAPSTVNQLRLRGLPPFLEIVRVARGRYDAVIADLPTGMSSATKALLRQAWRTYMFCTPEPPALHLARRRVREIKAGGVDDSSLRLVVSRWNERSVLGEPDIASVVGLPIAFKLPNDYAGIRDADRQGGLIASGRKLGRELRKLGRDAASPVRTRR